MKNYIDRHLHATLDDCLSGVDTLPSQQEAILQRIASHRRTPRRVQVRSLIAAVLLLTLISAAAAGAFSGVINWQGVPDESAQPVQPLPGPLHNANTDPMSARIASNFLDQFDSRMLRRVIYIDEDGNKRTRISSRIYEASSLSELDDLFVASELLLPQLTWPADRFDCNAYITYDCLSSGAYALAQEQTFAYDMVVSGFLPTEGADFISSVSLAGYTADGHRVQWKARYQAASDARGFGVSDIQQYRQLSIPGMTDAIAVTSSNKTWIYMRRVLDEPICYIPIEQLLRPDTPNAAFNEIYYEISAVGMTAEQLAALIPQ